MKPKKCKISKTRVRDTKTPLRLLKLIKNIDFTPEFTITKKKDKKLIAK